MKTYYNFDEWETAARLIGYIQHENEDWSWVAHGDTGECVGEYLQGGGYLYIGDDND